MFTYSWVLHIQLFIWNVPQQSLYSLLYALLLCVVILYSYEHLHHGIPTEIPTIIKSTIFIRHPTHLQCKIMKVLPSHWIFVFCFFGELIKWAFSFMYLHVCFAHGLQSWYCNNQYLFSYDIYIHMAWYPNHALGEHFWSPPQKVFTTFMQMNSVEAMNMHKFSFTLTPTVFVILVQMSALQLTNRAIFKILTLFLRKKHFFQCRPIRQQYMFELSYGPLQDIHNSWQKKKRGNNVFTYYLKFMILYLSLWQTFGSTCGPLGNPGMWLIANCILLYRTWMVLVLCFVFCIR